MDRVATHDLRDEATELRKYSAELRSNAKELIRQVNAAMEVLQSRLDEKRR